MLIVMQTNGLLAAAIFRISASGIPRGSASFRLFRRSVSSDFWFAGEVMMTSRNGLPISVGPMSTTESLPPPCFSRSR